MAETRDCMQSFEIKAEGTVEMLQAQLAVLMNVHNIYAMRTIYKKVALRLDENLARFKGKILNVEYTRNIIFKDVGNACAKTIVVVPNLDILLRAIVPANMILLEQNWNHDLSLRDNNILYGTTLLVRQQNNVNVVVKTLLGERCVLLVDLQFHTVLSLMHLLQSKFQTPASSQHLFFNYQKLNSEKTLADQGIRAGSVLLMVCCCAKSNNNNNYYYDNFEEAHDVFSWDQMHITNYLNLL